MNMEYMQVMREAAKAAGEFMRRNKNLTDATNKANANDFVTVADIKSQNFIRKELNAKFPNVLVVSEEDSEEVRKQLDDPAFTGFVIDPIDGTYNFKRGALESAISIGYVENGESKVGVVYDPYKDELFEAEVGKGALCNGQPIHVSQQPGLEGASVATSNGYNYDAAVRNFQRQIAIHAKTGIMPWTTCQGSAVLVLVWVAMGRIDAIHHTGFKPFDNAAAQLIIREAGGFVHTLQGKEARFTDGCVLAASPAVGHALEEIFKELDPVLLT